MRTADEEIRATVRTRWHLFAAVYVRSKHSADGLVLADRSIREQPVNENNFMEKQMTKKMALPVSDEVSSEGHHLGFYEKYIKRPQDALCALAGLIVLSPVMAVTAVMVRSKLGSPVLFRQERPGKDGRIFTLYKFRTMKDARDAQGNLLSDEERLSDFGRKLRSTSLDELPELINIFKGDMSVVGPRPLLVQYLPLYNEHQARRHEVRPGFTGYAQVHGRNAISWEDKFDKDVWYVDHVSFWQDWKIIFETISTVLQKKGISSETSCTMEPFTGTKTGQTPNLHNS